MLGSGRASPLFFDDLDINVTAAIEPKADLQRLVKDNSPGTQVFDDVREVVQHLENGELRARRKNVIFLLIISIGRLEATADADGDIGRSSQLDHSTEPDLYFQNCIGRIF